MAISSSHSKFLILGQQAREHALAWLLSRSGFEVHLGRSMPYPFDLNQFSIVPDFDEMDPDRFEPIVQYCKQAAIDCVIVGSTGPMERGLVDYLENAGITTLGANLEAVQLELSKVFSKAFMQRHGIPTPDYRICETLSDIEQMPEDCFPGLLKSDLVIRSHYGAVAVESKQAAIDIAPQIFETQNNYYGKGRVLLEQCLTGAEINFTVVFDGKHWLALPTSFDYKKLSDNDQGPNTSSMGSVSPAPDVNEQQLGEIVERIVKPSIAGIIDEGLTYRGFLYFGVMLTDTGPELLEYNCRLGDPEAQSVMMLLGEDFAEVLMHAARGTLDQARLSLREGFACAVYRVPKGYPDAIECGFPITIPMQNDGDPDLQIFAGAMQYDHQNERWLSGNNRVLCVSARGDTLAQARKSTYQKMALFQDDHLYFRTDIGFVSRKP